MTSRSIEIQTSSQSVPSTPEWMGEVTIVAHYLTSLGLIEKMVERVRFARAHFGTYDVIDFVVVLIGYSLSGEPTIEKYYERLRPFATPFMVLFGRNELPSRYALSRFLAAIDQPTVEALRRLFEEDLFSRPLTEDQVQGAGLQDRCGELWQVFDGDGTRQVARQRALPHPAELPKPHRRMDLICAPGYPGRKRGEVVRTRTTLLLAHTQQWFATFGGAGNGDYRGDLLRMIQVITSYADKQSLALSRLCPAARPLYAQERRAEQDGMVRVVYAARLADCRGCPLRERCQGHGKDTKNPHRVSAVLRPIGTRPPAAVSAPPPKAEHPVLWGDWDRCQTRRDFISLLRTQTVTITLAPSSSPPEEVSDPVPLTRSQRAHWHMSWAERFSRNTAKPSTPHVSIHLFGIPTSFAESLGFAAA